ncbi:DUF1349 domain-containing protein [Niveibacterium sp. SC-1]|uniref:DUF1349 domain-containing protein n=1 Tax=Niveibacterium sp. SC-1 TaxID=3135646 RepID=UPI00311DDD56
MPIDAPQRLVFSDARFHWLNPPPAWQAGECLDIRTGARTDFWQGTHYGFRRDDGHVFGLALTGDFCVETAVRFEGRQQYDQCGLMVRVDAAAWIKCSIEYEDAQLSRLGSVVTRRGYSDWATQDLEGGVSAARYRIHRSGADFLVEASLDLEGRRWRQLRICHLDDCPASLFVGPYACSPVGEAFECRFDYLSIGPSTWSAPA